MQVPPFTLERQYLEIGSDIEKEVLKVLKGGQFTVSYTHLTLPTT